MNAFWNAQPFPHFVVDNFLPQEEFNQLITKEHKTNKPAEADIVYNTAIEKAKVAVANDKNSPEILNVVDRITRESFLNYLSNVTGLQGLTPLTAYPNNAYRYHHRTKPGGILGPHVDHSYLDEAPGKAHILNCIFYAPPEWLSTYGGATELYGPHGWGKPLAKIFCIPNRLLIFLHTSESFHGVEQIYNNPFIPERLTIYMDYYIDIKNIPHGLNIWKHRTTFLPKDLKNLHRYLPEYTRYLLRRPLS